MSFAWFHEWANHIKVYLMSEYGSNYRIYKILWKNQGKQSFDYGKGTYTLNLKKAILSKKNNPILYFKLNNPEPLEIAEVHSVKGSATELRGILKDKSTTDVLNEGSENKTLLIIGIFIVVIIAIAGFSIYIISDQNKQIAKLALDLAKTYTNGTKPVVVIP